MRIYLLLILVLGMHSIQSSGQCLLKEQEFKEYYKNNISNLDPIKGIWSSNSTVKIYDSFNRLIDTKYLPQTTQIAIINTGDVFAACTITDTSDHSILSFRRTATLGVYLYNKQFSFSNAFSRANVLMTTRGLLEYTYEMPDEELKHSFGSNYFRGMSEIIEIKMIKLFPTNENYNKNAAASGTGFAISSDGFIVTNHHVIKDASSIKIRGIKGDFSKSLHAKVILDDKNNDLAILKIDDPAFSSCGIIPYLIATRAVDVGSSVFVLGYPLRATMGDEIKLTNGIVSAKSGFQGDVTSYQITAPVQPGNSGGPLFDNKGVLIGIINSKHSGAENASYAIKSSYILNLIDIMPNPPKLQTISAVLNKPFTEQVKILKKFIYIIEVN